MLVLKCNDFRNQHFYKSIKMNNTDIIDRTISFVRKKLKHAEGGHDWFHIERVYKKCVADCKRGSL
jgi:HD superfamily phosphodiesterase